MRAHARRAPAAGCRTVEEVRDPVLGHGAARATRRAARAVAQPPQPQLTSTPHTFMPRFFICGIHLVYFAGHVGH